ncbi:MAG: hypothetical protein J7647_01005 [Cyanobacteria bacterium SBLK]|nr:hypothetical protein [Cyanobacteria bacterium SBLK]
MGKKKYFLNHPSNQNILFLRNELHKVLAQEEFVVEFPVVNNEIIEIIENAPKASLKKVLIHNLNYNFDKFKVEKIWKINLEKDLQGISTSHKTPECAICILQKYKNEEEISYTLRILLIELKSSLDNEELKKIEDKFRYGMSRLYMLLVLNNHLNPIKGYNEEIITIDFRGILFFNNKNRLNVDDSKFYKILHTPSSQGKLIFTTLLRGKDQLNIKCFENINSEITIDLKDLLI